MIFLSLVYFRDNITLTQEYFSYKTVAIIILGEKASLTIT